VDDVLASRMRLLTAYQDAKYADRYRSFVDDVRKRVAALKLRDGEAFVREVALTLSRLMAYKDEYEVARLYTDGKFMQRIRDQFAGDFKMSFNLAPMMLPGYDSSGQPKKWQLGPWMMTMFKLLAPMKFLRGTPFDPIGYHPERRKERQLIVDYRALIERVLGGLDQARLPAAIELARAAADIRGYGPVKMASIKAYESKRLPELLEKLDNSAVHSQSRAA
jgi:indolepyruvate ferredoxin oxidoreductase